VILDFDSPAVDASRECDLCIVGAGAAGIAIALELVGSGRRVVVLESGGRDLDPDAQRLCESDLRGLRCASVHDGRARALGGTTTMWAGQALPLDDADFAPRDWVGAAGWPVSRAELAPYYRRAERLLGVPAVSYGDGDHPGDWPAALARPPQIGGLRARFSTFSPVPSFATAHGVALAGAPDVLVLLHATASRLTMAAGGARVEAVQVRSLRGREGHVCAARYVLCCGAVETPRLLLASASGDEAPGAPHDLVGRFFQEHLHIKVPLVPRNRRAIGRLMHTKRIGGVRHHAKLCATRELQRSERILAAGADLTYDVDANPALGPGRELAGALRGGGSRRGALRPLLGTLRHPATLARAGYGTTVVRRKASEGFGPMYLCLQVETAPRPESRVTLGAGTDALGVPRAVVDWRVGAIELRTAEVLAHRLDAGLRAAGLGRLDLSVLPLERDLDRLGARVASGCHHAGTTRMSDDPRAGVVDRDCRVHGVADVFVAGASVFPTSGWSNPTLTLLALAYRLADRLEQELAASGPVAGRPPARAVANVPAASIR
jgi:choline dehydrogenase-like flavoprotein